MLGSSAYKVLRNNGDGSFVEINPFPGASTIKDFAWGDLDADGDPDVALIDGADTLHVFANERQGSFTERAVPVFSGSEAIQIGEINNDGVLDLVDCAKDWNGHSSI